jgi:hypothetical protein
MVERGEGRWERGGVRGVQYFLVTERREYVIKIIFSQSLFFGVGRRVSVFLLIRT